MEEYTIDITPDASQDLEDCYLYILRVFKAFETAEAFLKDFDESMAKLQYVAGKLRIGDHPIMRERGLRRWNFLHHNYFMLFRMNGNTAEIVAIGHFRQDLRSVLR